MNSLRVRGEIKTLVLSIRFNICMKTESHFTAIQGMQMYKVTNNMIICKLVFGSNRNHEK